MSRSSSGDSGRSPSGSGNVPVGGVDESRVMELFSSHVSRLAESFASSMESSFEQLDSRIDEKLANVSTVPNRSLSDAPSQAPIQQTSCQGCSDPSFLTPRTRYGNLGGEQRESEPAVLAIFPPLNS